MNIELNKIFTGCSLRVKPIHYKINTNCKTIFLICLHCSHIIYYTFSLWNTILIILLCHFLYVLTHENRRGVWTQAELFAVLFKFEYSIPNTLRANIHLADLFDTADHCELTSDLRSVDALSVRRLAKSQPIPWTSFSFTSTLTCWVVIATAKLLFFAAILSLRLEEKSKGRASDDVIFCSLSAEMMRAHLSRQQRQVNTYSDVWMDLRDHANIGKWLSAWVCRHSIRAHCSIGCDYLCENDSICIDNDRDAVFAIVDNARCWCCSLSTLPPRRSVAGTLRSDHCVHRKKPNATHAHGDQL